MSVEDIVRLMTSAKCSDKQIMHVTGLTFGGLAGVRHKIEAGGAK